MDNEDDAAIVEFHRGQPDVLKGNITQDSTPRPIRLNGSGGPGAIDQKPFANSWTEKLPESLRMREELLLESSLSIPAASCCFKAMKPKRRATARGTSK